MHDSARRCGPYRRSRAHVEAAQAARDAPGGGARACRSRRLTPKEALTLTVAPLLELEHARRRATWPPELADRARELYAAGGDRPAVAEQLAVPFGTVKAWLFADARQRSSRIDPRSPAFSSLIRLAVAELHGEPSSEVLDVGDQPANRRLVPRAQVVKRAVARFDDESEPVHVLVERSRCLAVLVTLETNRLRIQTAGS